MKRLLAAVFGLSCLACAGLPQVGIPDDLTGCDAYIDHDAMPVWSPEQVLQGNVDALNDENLDCYMGVFHPDSAQISGTWVLTTGLFEQYDLHAAFDKPLEVDTISADEVLVSFVQVTHNRNSEPFDANRSRGTHTLRKDEDGRWRLVQTVLAHTEPWSPPP